MDSITKNELRQSVRNHYGKIADNNSAGCGCAPDCCSPGATDVSQASQVLGYSPDDVGKVPDGANMGLGCGNPQTIAALKPGETVLDLGSGGGFDCFLAAEQVGEKGLVIGVDMTPEMVSLARGNAEKGDYSNVEFRLGEIENIPVPDGIVDVIMSNCVINLSPDKEKVFAEAFRVLKPGGRLAVSDVVAKVALPESAKKDLSLHSACIAGASVFSDMEQMLKDAGFSEIRIDFYQNSSEIVSAWVPGSEVTDYVGSAKIEAVKPVG